MDAEELRQMAHAEIEEALVRFWARAGNLANINEWFANSLAAWLADWTESYLLPEQPDDVEETDEERTFRERIERARRDLELRREPPGGADGALRRRRLRCALQACSNISRDSRRGSLAS
jgi:hypothetical protein